MTTVTRTPITTPRPPASTTTKVLTGAAAVLALLCLVALVAMTFSAKKARQATAGQDYSECIDNAFRQSISISVCGERYKAGAR